MTNYLLISGSPRKGNTEFILKTIFEQLNGKKELVLLRDRKIERCAGCLNCDKTKTCIINDDMIDLNKKLSDADTIIIGSPNYYDNVSGLLKDFIDRTNPLYDTGILKGKKVYAVITGGGKIRNSKKVARQAVKHFADAHKMNYVKEYCFKAVNPTELEEKKNIKEEIEKITKDVKKGVKSCEKSHLRCSKA